MEPTLLDQATGDQILWSLVVLAHLIAYAIGLFAGMHR